MEPKRTTKTQGVPKVNTTPATRQKIGRISAVKGWNLMTTLERVTDYFLAHDRQMKRTSHGQ